MKFLSRWTEVVQPFPTHFDPKGNTLSKLDRAFISCPSSLTLKLNIQCSVVGKPEECFANFESDHAPLALCFGRPLRLKIGELPIPRWICKHPNFKYHLNLLIDSVCILDLEVSQQLFIHKKCIREAAKRVRGDCLFLDPQGAFSNKLVLSSVSRALCLNDLSLAARLLRHAPIAADLIFVDRGLVCAYSYENFENVFGDFFRVYHRTEVGRLQSDLAATSAPIIQKQIKSRLQCARRMQ